METWIIYMTLRVIGNMRIIKPTYWMVCYGDCNNTYHKNSQEINVSMWNCVIEKKVKEFNDNTITMDDTYLGPFQHDNKLKVGSIQCVGNDDIGPYYMSDAKERKNMINIQTLTLVDLNVDELQKPLKEISINAKERRKIN